jgi:asparagine synthase (glutamine-hydrolysing)
MCGIAGAWTDDPAAAGRAVERMCRAMVTRGPDGAGVALLEATGGTLALGNRRLAVIDPSPAGHQPMRDPARGTVIVFNGFIANFAELRARLLQEGERFTSHCDTEVVLKAYGRYGPACVGALRGMFAIAIWDPRVETLFLARDPFGIKPLYYWQRGDRLLFASQVKALLASGLVPPELSADGLETFLAFGGVREPLTAIASVYALPAGHTAVVRRGRLQLTRFWHPPCTPDLSMGWAAAARALRAELADAVARYVTSDVPLGLFLSGGLDSSVLAALAAAALGPSQLVGVSLVADAAGEELAAMRAVAQAVGATHVVVPLPWSEVARWLPRVFVAMDQPTFDGVNTYAVARAASGSGLKVALSGLGADELFDGYGYRRRVAALERVRFLAERFGVARPTSAVAGRLLPGRKGEKARAWLEGQLPAGAAHELLRRLFLPREVERLRRRAAPSPAEGRMTALRDLEGYTRDVLLRDADCMSMAHGLEVRVPFLDQTLVGFAVRLPIGPRQAAGKRLLVEAARDLLPAAVLARRKRGFVLPIDRWLRGPLRREVEATLRAPPGAVAELVDRDEMLGLWRRFLAGRGSWHGAWALYVLCRWVASLAGAAWGADQCASCT